MMATIDLLGAYRDGGPFMHLLLLFFLFAFAMQLTQLLLARKMTFHGLLHGWATVLLGLAIIGMAVGGLLMFEVLSEQGMNRGSMLKGIEIVLIPPLFTLGMIIVLGFLQLVADALTRKARRDAPGRAARVVGALATLGLLVGGLAGVRWIMMLTGLAAHGEALSGEIAESVRLNLRLSYGAGFVAVGLGAVVLVISVLSAIRGGFDGAREFSQK